MYFKYIVSFFLLLSISACSTTMMPRVKIKNTFSDAFIGDDISELLNKLEKQGYDCSNITDVIAKEPNNAIPEKGIVYKCSIETDTTFCLHTGSVIFGAQNNKLAYIQQGVYRSKVCIND